jgi:hypothetical protein
MMTDESGSEVRRPSLKPPQYEPPRVEDLPVEDAPAVTAAGVQKTDLPTGAEWRP